ncbi:MAG: exosortase/archaeosortase family protein [Phycisphaerales bacterium JB065]
MTPKQTNTEYARPRGQTAAVACRVWSSPIVARIGRKDPVALAAAGVLLAGLVWVYWMWVVRQFGPNGFSARYFEDWGHAFAIPVISGIYVWINRHLIRWDRSCVYWPGIALVLLGTVMYSFFLLNIALANHMLQGFSMILTVSGLVLLLVGPHVFRQLLFPIGFLGFAVTISELIMNQITEKLQDLAAVGSEVLLRMLQFDVTRLGNQLTVFNSAGEGYPLEVAEACSGMRMVVAFVALAVAVGFFSCRQWWHRVAVVLLAVPVAVFMNIVRVAVLAGITLVNPDFSVGGAHTLIGTLLLVPAFLLFMFCVWLLKKITPDVMANEGEQVGAA